jgi:probable HAF family extracellular repeat protein
MMPRPSRLLCLLLALAAAPLAARAAPTYTVAPITDLGNNGGQPMGINNAGQVAGYAYTPGGRGYAYVSKDGNTSSLHPADGSATGSSARGINEGGAVVGEVVSAGTTRAAVFANGSVQVLGTLGGNYSSGYAINANGTVTGVSDTANGSRHGFVTGANGSLVDIGPLNGGYSSAANAITTRAP